MGLSVTARTKLGEAITFHLDKLGRGDREVSQRIGVAIRDVERFKSGELVPDRGQWKRLCQQVAKQLFSIQGLHSDALREQDADREASIRALRRNGHTQESNGMVVTHVGDKLMAAIAPPQESVPPSPPEQAPEEIETVKKRRPGRSYESQKLRIDRAREILTQRPAIKIRGQDGLMDILIMEFGVGLDAYKVKEIRDELQAQRDAQVSTPTHADPLMPARSIQSDSPVVITASSAAAKMARPPERVTETGKVRDADVSAGVELIMGAIPGLREMRIVVDEHGVAYVSYSINHVKITTVSSSLTVRR